MKKIFSKKTSPLKRLLLCVAVLSFSVFLISPRPAYAQFAGIWDWFKWGMSIGGNINELKNMDMDWWVSHAGTASVNFVYRITTGCDHDTLLQCATNNFTNEGELNCDPCRPGGEQSPIGGGETAFMPGGALGYTTLALQGFSETKPPFSLAFYAKKLKGNTLLGGETYAGPVEWGVDALRRYYKDIFAEVTYQFWRQTRNLSYVLFVVILIAMGFMVMFRTKIDPRTTMTVTGALPKVAVGLILVTFSYPIVSFAVDLVFVLTAVARNLIITVWSNMAGSLGGLVDPSDYTGIMAEILSLTAAVFNRRINLFSMLLFLVIFGVIILTIFLALWEWLKRFARLCVAGIFGPLIIAWGTIPGKGDVITGWFKGLIANILALPAIFLVMNAGILVLLVNQPAPDDLPLFFPLITDLAGQSLQFIIGFMILWQAHKIPKAIDEALEATAWTGGGGEKKKKK